ncbi:hypothetical protein CMV_005742 [Castanea mollissima]|uniref:60S acidic ribosomal protein P0 n=1 Tax=Castanea mollissima TaxID=60419 RepID=A0A8J4RD39_9ROSI|nr:hypothetical protein CMV_005742 [Castanea mollissima]
MSESGKGLCGDSVVLMGKNTMMKRYIRIHADNTGNNAFLNLIPLLVGNVGLIFTKGDLKEVNEEVAKYKVGALACVGLVAPIDVVVPPGNTDLDPSQTSFFQLALSYPALAAAPHMFTNAYKNVLAVAVATENSFPQAKKVKEYLKDPSKFVVATTSVVAAASGGAPGASAAKEEEKKEEPAEESNHDMSFSLFD